MSNINNTVRLGAMVLITKAIESIVPNQFNTEQKNLTNKVGKIAA